MSFLKPERLSREGTRVESGFIINRCTRLVRFSALIHPVEGKNMITRRQLVVSVALSSVLGLGLVGCGDKGTSGEVTLTVGATPVPHAEILNFIAPQLKKEGINLKVVEFSDYVKPNLALSDKEIDANFFQHIPYLESFSAERGLKLSILCDVHIEPMGAYSKKVKSLKDLPEGAKVAIPNDPTNGGRALKVLADAGLITLKDGVGVKGTPADIVNNRLNLRIVELEAATLPRTLDDVDLAVINSNFAMNVGLNPSRDALTIEAKNSPYANVVAIRTGDDRPALKKLAAALRTPDVKKFIEEKYKGAVVPTF